MGQSLSKIPVKITLLGIGESTAELNRLTAPLTVGEVIKKLPINTRTSPAMGYVNVLIGIKRGVEKPVTRVEEGTIAYWPRGDAICIYPKSFTPYSPVNKIGRIIQGMDIFTGVRSGTRIIIERV